MSFLLGRPFLYFQMLCLFHAMLVSWRAYQNVMCCVRLMISNVFYCIFYWHENLGHLWSISLVNYQPVPQISPVPSSPPSCSSKWRAAPNPLENGNISWPTQVQITISTSWWVKLILYWYEKDKKSRDNKEIEDTHIGTAWKSDNLWQLAFQKKHSPETTKIPNTPRPWSSKFTPLKQI